MLDVATRCAMQLHDLVPVLKERVEDTDEYERFAKGVALVSSYLLTEVLNPVYAQYPELNPLTQDVDPK